MADRSAELFSLLPAVHRIRDAELAAAQGTAKGPLESLLALVAREVVLWDRMP